MRCHVQSHEGSGDDRHLKKYWEVHFGYQYILRLKMNWGLTQGRHLLKSIRDDSYWTSSKNSLELLELSSISKVSLV